MKLSRRQALKAIPAAVAASGVWTLADMSAHASFTGNWWLDWPHQYQIAWYLLINIQTGDDDLRRQSRATIDFSLGNSVVRTSELPQQNLNVPGEAWDNGTWRRVRYDFLIPDDKHPGYGKPVGYLVRDIQQINIRFWSGRPDGWFSSPDKWHIQTLEVYYDPNFDPYRWPYPDPYRSLSGLKCLYRGTGNPLRAFYNGWNRDIFTIDNPFNQTAYRPT